MVPGVARFIPLDIEDEIDVVGSAHVLSQQVIQNKREQGVSGPVIWTHFSKKIIYELVDEADNIVDKLAGDVHPVL